MMKYRHEKIWDRPRITLTCVTLSRKLTDFFLVLNFKTHPVLGVAFAGEGTCWRDLES